MTLGLKPAFSMVTATVSFMIASISGTEEAIFASCDEDGKGESSLRPREIAPRFSSSDNMSRTGPVSSGSSLREINLSIPRTSRMVGSFCVGREPCPARPFATSSSHNGPFSHMLTRK